MADQMPEGSDNAGSYDLDITTPQNMAPISTDTSANGAGIASDLEKQIKRLTEQYRKGTNNDNNEYNILKCLIDEKYKLLFNLNSPINSILSAQIENEKMLKKIVQQLNNLLNQSAEYLRAYVAHCDEAVKANNLLRSNTEYDEFIHMSYETLLSHNSNMMNQRKSLQVKTAEMREQLKLKEKIYQNEYTSLREELQVLQKYEIDALEAIEQAKFDVQNRRRKTVFQSC